MDYRFCPSSVKILARVSRVEGGGGARIGAADSNVRRAENRLFQSPRLLTAVDQPYES